MFSQLSKDQNYLILSRKIKVMFSLNNLPSSEMTWYSFRRVCSAMVHGMLCVEFIGVGGQQSTSS